MAAGDKGGARADPLGERVYQGVKAHVLSAAHPGQRLDVEALTLREKASLTPVRAALHRLIGEGLVEANLSSGFRVSSLSQGRLRDLYDWNRLVLVQAAGSSKAKGEVGFKSPARLVGGRDIARLFHAVARGVDNVEIERAVEGLNDRLHRVRMFEPSILGGTANELREIERCLAGGEMLRLGELIQAYHQRRLQAIEAIVRLIDRADI